jgi:hypothetical protein
MTKKQWRRPEVKRIEAGSAEGLPGNDIRDAPGGGNPNKS